MSWKDFEDFFDFSFGPFHMGVFPRPFKLGYSRTSDTHLLRVKLRQDIQKEDIKVRFTDEGMLEIEWPRKTRGRDIPVE